MKKIVSIAAFAALALGLAIAGSAKAASFSVNPWVYDPGNTGTAVAQWVAISTSTTPTATSTPTNPTYPTNKEDCKKGGWMNPAYQPAFKNQGQCVSQAAKAQDNGGVTTTNEFALSLQKNAPTATNSAAGATLEGLSTSTVLSELGFDYQGYCGAGAPRFNVYTSSGTYYFFGCTYGTHTDLGNGWTRVRFNNADAVAANGDTPAFPGFGSTTVTRIEIVQDEGPAQVLLDNIDVNGMLVGNP